MKITKISNDFTPISKGVFFGIDTENSEPSDLMVEVVDVATNEVVAVQQLRGVTEAQVNIAPYLNRFAERAPRVGAYSMFAEAPTAIYQIRVGNITSEVIVVSVNRDAVSQPSLVTTLPTSRVISRGESDELLLIAEAGDTLEASIATDAGDDISVEYVTSGGATIFLLSTAELSPSAKTLDVKLSLNGEEWLELHYRVAPAYKGAVRMAWLSEEGSVEQYTFLTATRAKLQVDKQTIATQSNRRVVQSHFEQSVSLISRYEPRSVIDALSQIVCSPRVWIIEGESLTEVEVKSSAIDFNLFGEPDCVAVDICVNRGEWVV